MNTVMIRQWMKVSNQLISFKDMKCHFDWRIRKPIRFEH